MRQFVLEGFLHLFSMTSGKGFEKCSHELAVHVQDTHGPDKKQMCCVFCEPEPVKQLHKTLLSKPQNSREEKKESC